MNKLLACVTRTGHETRKLSDILFLDLLEIMTMMDTPAAHGGWPLCIWWVHGPSVYPYPKGKYIEVNVDSAFCCRTLATKRVYHYIFAFAHWPIGRYTPIIWPVLEHNIVGRSGSWKPNKKAFSIRLPTSPQVCTDYKYSSCCYPSVVSF